MAAQFPVRIELSPSLLSDRFVVTYLASGRRRDETDRPRVAVSIELAERAVVTGRRGDLHQTLSGSPVEGLGGVLMYQPLRTCHHPNPSVLVEGSVIRCSKTKTFLFRLAVARPVLTLPRR